MLCLLDFILVKFLQTILSISGGFIIIYIISIIIIVIIILFILNITILISNLTRNMLSSITLIYTPNIILTSLKLLLLFRLKINTWPWKFAFYTWLLTVIIFKPPCHIHTCQFFIHIRMLLWRRLFWMFVTVLLLL